MLFENKHLAAVLLASLLLSACGSAAASAPAQSSAAAASSSVQAADSSVPEESEQVDAAPSAEADAQIDLNDESVALSSSPAALPNNIKPVASGTAVEKNSKAVIDYSNVSDGYIMVQYTVSTSKRLKAQVKGPNTTYTYNLTAGKWEVFPLSDGNGSYQVTIFENVQDTKYAAVLSKTMSVSLNNEFAPFLHPNQYVDFSVAPKTVAKAAELTAGLTAPLDKVTAVYNYVVNNITYDTQLAANVKSGYLPVLDTVLEKKTGICFDYAALMTGMLRSQDVPCKLVVGYAGTAYHAWISVYSQDDGWIDDVIYFDGTSWQRMDPTFASTGNKSSAAMQFIGDGKNYTTKYLY